MLALYRSGRQADALTVAASTERVSLTSSASTQAPSSRRSRPPSCARSPALDLIEAAPVASVPPPGPPPGRARRRTKRPRQRGGRRGRGRGQCVAVAGDPGTGKTALVEGRLRRRSPATRAARAVRPLTTPRPYGPLRDIAAAAAVTVWDRGADVVLSEICDEAVSALGTEPTVLVVEDLHWVDAADRRGPEVPRPPLRHAAAVADRDLP